MIFFTIDKFFTVQFPSFHDHVHLRKCTGNESQYLNRQGNTVRSEKHVHTLHLSLVFIDMVKVKESSILAE